MKKRSKTCNKSIALLLIGQLVENDQWRLMVLNLQADIVQVGSWMSLSNGHNPSHHSMAALNPKDNLVQVFVVIAWIGELLKGWSDGVSTTTMSLIWRRTEHFSGQC